MKLINLKYRKLNWNISILVILVLLACSLMGILSMNFLNNLISYTDNSYSYYNSYYYAKAWLELALTEIDNSDVWFSHEIWFWDVINQNFSNEGAFNVNIMWRSTFLSNKFWQNRVCDETTALSIPAKWSMTLPMFYDDSSDYNTIFSSINSIHLLSNDRNKLSVQYLWDWYSYPKLDVWVIFQSWDSILWDYIYMTWLDFKENFFKNYFQEFGMLYWEEPWNNSMGNDPYLSYIVISNPTDDEVKFCIDAWSDTSYKVYWWPTTKYFISSRWEYRGKTVWLQAIYAQPLPSFFINPYVSTSIDQGTMPVNEWYAE